MKTTTTLSLLFLVAPVLAQSPLLVFNGFDTVVSCLSEPITWVYSGPDSPLSLVISNVEVDQNSSTTSTPPNTFTNALFDKRYAQRQRRDVIYTQIAAALSPSAGSFLWPKVTVPQGNYKIYAIIDEASYSQSSAVFHVSEGSDISCLTTTSSTATTGSSTALTTPPPTSTQESLPPSSPTSSIPTPVGGSSSTNVGAIAGGVVGGFVVLLAVSLLYFFFVCRPRQSRRRTLARQNGGLGSPQDAGYDFKGQGKYGGLTSFDSHHMLDSRDAGYNLHTGALGSPPVGVAAAGSRGLDPPPAAERRSRERPDREQQVTSPPTGPYGLTVNTNAARSRRHLSQAESLATTATGRGSRDDNDPFYNSNYDVTSTDRGLARSQSRSRSQGHDYSPSEEKYDLDATEMDVIPALSYGAAETRRRPSLSRSTGPQPTSPSIPGTAKKPARKPVPIYDPSMASDTLDTPSPSNSLPTPSTLVAESPFEPHTTSAGHYGKRQPGADKIPKSSKIDARGAANNEQNTWATDDPRQIALNGQRTHELQHKSSFGLGGKSGPVYELMPDILPSQQR